jgi:hypothetical protein
MTREVFTPTDPSTVGGTGPYTISHPYAQAADLEVAVIAAGVRTVLELGDDYTVSPASSDTTGVVTLTVGAAAEHAGAQLTIERNTELEQGWQGLQGARERSLEAQLDIVTMAAQEVQRRQARTLRFTRDVEPIVPQAGRAIIFDDLGQPVAGPTADQVADAQGYAEAAELAAETAEDAAALVTSRLPTGQTVTRTIGTLEDFPTQTDWTNQFDGDNSESAIQLDWRYENTGANPFGSSAGAYRYAPHITPIFAQLRVGANVGFNDDTDANGPGRTGATVIRSRISHAGQGDAVCFNGSAFVSGTKSGSTHFLANPAAVLVNGDMQAGADGVYLNAGEFLLTDLGFDAAGIGFVYNLRRANGTGAKEAGWEGVRVQSQGAQAIDSGVMLSGAMDVGLNLSRQTVGDVAIAVAPSKTIAFGCTSDGTTFGTDLVENDVRWDGDQIIWRIGGTDRLKIKETGVDVNGGIFVAGTQIATSRRTGWAAASGTATRTTFATGSVTLPQLAERVKALIDDLITHGLIGAS